VVAPKLDRILETALYVDDLPRARRFYEAVLGLSPMFEDARLVAYGIGNGSVLLLFLRGATAEGVQLDGGSIPGHDGAGPLHYAFAIGFDEVGPWRAHLAAEGVAIESEVSWPGGVASLYFRDPDGHLVELATPGLWPNER
jgi:catechol 2,3-dioxygenase-like lactoylglutathione lyase family enzyme